MRNYEDVQEFICRKDTDDTYDWYVKIIYTDGKIQTMFLVDGQDLELYDCDYIAVRQHCLDNNLDVADYIDNNYWTKTGDCPYDFEAFMSMELANKVVRLLYDREEREDEAIAFSQYMHQLYEAGDKGYL